MCITNILRITYCALALINKGIGLILNSWRYEMKEHNDVKVHTIVFSFQTSTNIIRTNQSDMYKSTKKNKADSVLVVFIPYTDERASLPFRHGGTCTDRVNSYACSCASGYEGNTCGTGKSYILMLLHSVC